MLSLGKISTMSVMDEQFTRIIISGSIENIQDYLKANPKFEIKVYHLQLANVQVFDFLCDYMEKVFAEIQMLKS